MRCPRIAALFVVVVAAVHALSPVIVAAGGDRGGILSAALHGLGSSRNLSSDHELLSSHPSSSDGADPPHAGFIGIGNEVQQEIADFYQKAGLSFSRAGRAILQELHDEKSEQLWPIPAKVCVVLCFFVLLEYFLDYCPWVGLTQPITQKSQKMDGGQACNYVEDDYNEDADSLTVLSLNIWVNQARENVHRQIDAIRRLNPDVICLQEVFHLDVLAAYRAAFPEYALVAWGKDHNFSALFVLMAIMLLVATAYSWSINLVERTLGVEHWRSTWFLVLPFLCFSYSWLVRNHWMVVFLSGNRTGLAMLVRLDKIELDLRNNCCIGFSPLGQADDYLNALRPRGYISVPGLIRRRDGRKPVPVRLANTHLNQPLEQPLGVGRHRQVKEILEHVRDSELFVLGCDLNATPPGTVDGSDCKTYLDTLSKLSDSWEESNPSDPNRDGLTWDQNDNPMCTSMFNALLYGRTLRWRCDFVFWRWKQCPSALDASSINGEPPKLATAVDNGPVAGVDVSVRSCTMVFTGKEAVSDHFGVFTVFDIKPLAKGVLTTGADSDLPETAGNCDSRR